MAAQTIHAPREITALGHLVVVQPPVTRNSAKVGVHFLFWINFPLLVCGNGGPQYACPDGQYQSGSLCTGLTQVSTQTCASMLCIKNQTHKKGEHTASDDVVVDVGCDGVSGLLLLDAAMHYHVMVFEP